jgi:hexosaminidase
MVRLIVILAMLSVAYVCRAAEVNVLPKPAKVEVLAGEPAKVLAARVRTETVRDPSLGDEGYVVEVVSGAAVIRAATSAGLFYGRQTVDQLLDFNAPLPPVRITDYPRFGYRGMLLDSARHMQSVESIKRTIDLLAHYKINRLHWHLSDDVGWRIEIKRRPKLSSVGAYRIGANGKYGGFYTQAQIREIVGYARQRFVTVIPEIEMPGHAQAIVAAYPQASCRGEQVPVLAEFKASDTPLCPSNENTYALIGAVLDEVCQMFPSPVIHLGGDECPREPWKNCPRCQALMKQKGFTSADQLQVYFTQRVADMLRQRKRRMMGWGEVLAPEIGKDVIVQQWLNPEAGRNAAATGHDVVVSQHEWLYLDYSHERLPLNKVYAFEPIPPDLPDPDAKHFLGIQANLWTENYADDGAQQRQIWPRMLAVAEVAWSQPEGRDFDDFRNRLLRFQYEHLAKRLAGARGPSATTSPAAAEVRQKLAERGDVVDPTQPQQGVGY